MVSYDDPLARAVAGSVMDPLPRRFSWAPVPGASGYRVEFFRGGQMVFAADTIQPEVTIPKVWVLGARRVSLEPGEYRWYVWPVNRGLQARDAVVSARLVIAER